MYKILSTYICWKKYIKCNNWRVVVRPSYIEDARFLKVKIYLNIILLVNLCLSSDLIFHIHQLHRYGTVINTIKQNFLFTLRQ